MQSGEHVDIKIASLAKHGERQREWHNGKEKKFALELELKKKINKKYYHATVLPEKKFLTRFSVSFIY